MLKQYLMALTLAGAVATIAPSAMAQNSAPADPQSATAGSSQRGGRHGDFDPAKKTAKLTRKLKLTADQQPKVQDILTSEKSQMDAVKADSSTSQVDRRSKMMGIRKASNDQLRAVLNSDQQKKWDVMQSKEQNWHGRHNKAQGSGTTADSGQN